VFNGSKTVTGRVGTNRLVIEYRWRYSLLFLSNIDSSLLFHYRFPTVVTSHTVCPITLTNKKNQIFIILA